MEIFSIAGQEDMCRSLVESCAVLLMESPGEIVKGSIGKKYDWSVALERLELLHYEVGKLVQMVEPGGLTEETLPPLIRPSGRRRVIDALNPKRNQDAELGRFHCPQ